MAIVDTFSFRKQQSASAGKAEVYVYDKIPDRLRVQVQQIVMESMGNFHPYTGNEFGAVAENNAVWLALYKTVLKELARHRLCKDSTDPRQDIINFIGQTDHVDTFIDVVEITFRMIGGVNGQFSDHERHQRGIAQRADEAIEELNIRFQRSGFGYQFTSGRMIRVDSTFAHAEMVKPALSLLTRAGFAGAQQEFMTAHGHYREGNYKDAITWANKAFESTMKSICAKKKWPVDHGARASDLVKTLKREKLWPDYLDGSFDQLIGTLKSGLPQVRNEAGAHGDGPVPVNTPSYVAAYALHLAAAKIILMVEAAFK